MWTVEYVTGKGGRTAPWQAKYKNRDSIFFWFSVGCFFAFFVVFSVDFRFWYILYIHIGIHHHFSTFLDCWLVGPAPFS